MTTPIYEPKPTEDTRDWYDLLYEASEEIENAIAKRFPTRKQDDDYRLMQIEIVRELLDKAEAEIKGAKGGIA